MKVYVGQSRGANMIAKLTALGFGEMTVREEYPPRRRPWAFDNGAFKDFRAGKTFNASAFMASIARIVAAGDRPDFIVVPDIVQGGEESLAFSMRWALSPAMAGIIAPRYLAVQDGMEPALVDGVHKLYDGIFVGGSLQWKVKTGASWVVFAHERKMRCHIGRVGTFRRTRWALRAGADSIDSCLPLWSEENMQRFLRAFQPSEQEEFEWKT